MGDFTPFGFDMLGDAIQQMTNSPVAERFLVAPFSVLNTRSGEWQERKRAWLNMGIQGEIGRQCGNGSGSHCLNNPNNVAMSLDSPTVRRMISIADGASPFDPVLCELVYRWFSGPGAQVVDPFAGGSVRGIVASCLGRRYWGCDLRPEQIDANREQAARLCPDAGRVPISVSGAMLRQLFHPCQSEFITGTCRGQCCQGTNGIMVTIHESERVAIEAQGATVKDGYIVADKRGLCPFKSDDGFCRIHGRGKPFGCQASPFTLNGNGTLIVRNRYRVLKCYACAESMPAHQAHAWSLDAVLGSSEAARVSALAANGADKIAATIGAREYAMMVDNDDAKHGTATEKIRPAIEYVCGDAIEVLDAAPAADLIFSCPPYGDLEVYSDDPRDLSNMEWHTFVAAYKRVVLKACKRLRPDRFACFVVGDFRDLRGYYRNFAGETINAFRECGLELYNEAILVTSVGSASMRVTRQFNGGRKLCKTHQNVLVFCKGDWRRAAAVAKQ